MNTASFLLTAYRRSVCFSVLAFFAFLTPTLALAALDFSGSGPFEISTEAELGDFATAVNGGNDFSGKTVKLTADIELTSAWMPIGSGDNLFKGTFDGQGYTISELNVSYSENAGLFGVVGNGTVIKDVNVSAKKIEVLSDEFTDYAFAGVLVGYATGSLAIIGCHASGEVIFPGTSIKEFVYLGGLIGSVFGELTVENSSFTGEVSASKLSGSSTYSKHSYQGGLIGGVYGAAIIKNSYANGNISANTNSGKFYLGGLVGRAVDNLTIEKSYSGVNILSGYSGSMGGLVGQTYGETAAIKNSYSSGNIRGSSSGTFVGGLVGSEETDYGITIENSYVSGNVSCGSCNVDYASGALGTLIGLIFYAELKAQSVYYNASYLGGASKAVGTLNSQFVDMVNPSYGREENYDDGEHGIFGLSDDELKMQTSFKGWDFGNIWGIDEDESYPYLHKFTPAPIRSLPQLANRISVQTTGNAIMLGNLPGNAKIEMYNLQGKRVYSTNSGNSQSLKILVQAKSVYVVKVNGKTFKVMLGR